MIVKYTNTYFFLTLIYKNVGLAKKLLKIYYICMYME